MRLVMEEIVARMQETTGEEMVYTCIGCDSGVEEKKHRKSFGEKAIESKKNERSRSLVLRTVIRP